jgi:hypothetical protein
MAVYYSLHVCPSVRNNSAPTGRICMTFDIWVFLENLSGENTSFIKIWQENPFFTWRPTYIYGNILLNSS